MPQESAGGDPDQDIVDLLRSGAQAEAFGMLATRYERKVFRLSCGLLRDTAAAEDAAQESLVRIWRALPGFDGRARLSTWIYTIARNRALSALERRRVHESLSDPTVESAAEQALGAAAAPPAAAGDDRALLLRDWVDALPERYRRALVLYYFEDQDVGAVADQLGMPQGTVKTLLHRGRALLLAKLEAAGLDDVEFWLETSS